MMMVARRSGDDGRVTVANSYKQLHQPGAKEISSALYVGQPQNSATTSRTGRQTPEAASGPEVRSWTEHARTPEVTSGPEVRSWTEHKSWLPGGLQPGVFGFPEDKLPVKMYREKPGVRASGTQAPGEIYREKSGPQTERIF